MPSEGMHQTVRPEVEESHVPQCLLKKIPPRVRQLTDLVGTTNGAFQTGSKICGIIWD